MYNLVTIQTAEDVSREMLAYENLDEVNAAMFAKLAYASAYKPITRCICSILDDNNIMIKRLEWNRTIIEAPQTEEEQTEEE